MSNEPDRQEDWADKYGVSYKTSVPASVMVDFRTACDSLGVSLKEGFNALLRCERETLRRRIVAGQLSVRLKSDGGDCKEDVQFSTHLPRDDRRRLAEVADAMKIFASAAGSLIMVGLHDDMAETIRAGLSQ
jgi:hypothetical protein